MNTKKLLSCALILVASTTLFAQSSKSRVQQFSSTGSNWTELNLGATLYTADARASEDTVEGFSMLIKSNFVLLENNPRESRFGLDLGLSFAYDNLDIDDSRGNFNIDANSNAYSLALELKPYIYLLKEDNVNIKAFFNPFISYSYVDLSAGFSYSGYASTINMYEDAVGFGAKFGFEVSFLKDFYVAPAYRYLRLEPIGCSADGEDIHSAEIELGYRITQAISMNFKYSYTFEGSAPSNLSMYMDKLMLGVRLTY